ncbi:MAG: hypothetical protein A2Y63_06625 [Candidatus Riflebacteria bacterium RBG_13_59_9]|nr:MAG: hypothetical protein A2Y63_06625 [Candidatus Riflebacteria bacterium RBG_13_59_9]
MLLGVGGLALADLVFEEETIFVRFTTEHSISNIEPLTNAIRDFALPVFYEEGDTLRPLFCRTRLPAGATIHFIVRRAEMARLEEEFKRFCGSLGGARP